LNTYSPVTQLSAADTGISRAKSRYETADAILTVYSAISGNMSAGYIKAAYQKPMSGSYG
jgi:hypothetical protein